eukprot:7386279-Prymnesium_polylepis.1
MCAAEALSRQRHTAARGARVRTYPYRQPHEARGDEVANRDCRCKDEAECDKLDDQLQARCEVATDSLQDGVRQYDAQDEWWREAVPRSRKKVEDQRARHSVHNLEEGHLRAAAELHRAKRLVSLHAIGKHG